MDEGFRFLLIEFICIAFGHAPSKHIPPTVIGETTIHVCRRCHLFYSK